MDPLSAVGLAGTIVQFVDFSLKIVGEGVELYKSGSLELNKQVEFTTRDLRNFTTKLRVQQSTHARDAVLSENDLALETLCHDCNEVAEQLLERLKKLEVTIAPPKPAADDATKEEKEILKKKYIQYNKEKLERVGRTLSVALLNIWSRGQVQEITLRLEKYRAAIQTRLLGALV